MKNNRDNQHAQAATIWGKLCLSSVIILAVAADYNTNGSSLANNQSFHNIFRKCMHYFLDILLDKYTRTEKYLHLVKGVEWVYS